MGVNRLDEWFIKLTTDKQLNNHQYSVIAKKKLQYIHP